MTSTERELEDQLIAQLQDLKYVHRTDIRDRAALEANFRKHFQALNHVRLTEGEFQRLLDEIVTPEFFAASHTLRNRNCFTRDDATPLNYTLVTIADWCNNTFEVIRQLRINTDYSHDRYDVILVINGVSVSQVKIKTFGINPRQATEQIVEYKKYPGNSDRWHTTGSGKTRTFVKDSTLLKGKPKIEKRPFVVDRKTDVPGQYCYCTQISVGLWFREKNTNADSKRSASDHPLLGLKC